MNGHSSLPVRETKNPNPDITLPASIKAELLRGLLRTGFNGLWTASLGAAAVYFILSAAHLLILAPPARWFMAALAMLTGVTMLAVAWMVKKRPDLYRYSFQLWVFFFGLCQFNSLAHLYFDPQPHQTTNLILVNIAVGIALFSTRWAAAFYSVSTIAWMGLVYLAPPSDQWVHFFFAYFQGLVIGLLVHLIRKRSVKDQILKEIFLKQQNVALRNARRAAEAAAKAKEVFLASMSHELRTPLNSIIGYSEMIEADLQDYQELTDTQQDVETIHRSGRHLLSVINNVLNLAKIDSEEATVNCTSVGIADIVEEVIQTTLPLIHKNGNQITWPDIENGLVLETDPLKLKQILLNLLGNAAKFTHNGQIGVDVKIDQNQNHIEFVIQDSGIGIEPDKIPHLFEAFWQADSSYTRPYEGTGLGLTISEQYAHQLGGHISVFSEPNKGSTFCLTLPLKI